MMVSLLVAKRVISFLYFCSDAVVRLKRLYMFAHENDLRVEVCAIVQDRKSVAFSFQVTFMFIEDSASMLSEVN